MSHCAFFIPMIDPTPTTNIDDDTEDSNAVLDPTTAADCVQLRTEQVIEYNILACTRMVGMVSTDTVVSQGRSSGQEGDLAW